MRQYGRVVATAREVSAKGSYDLALLPRYEEDRHDAILLAYLSGAQWRVGYVSPNGDEAGALGRDFSRLLTHPIGRSSADDRKHAVALALDTLRRVGGDVADEGIEAWYTSEDDAAARRFLHERGASDDDAFVAMCLGGKQRRRMWPRERYAAVGRWLSAQHGVRLLIIGGPGDEDAGAYLKEQLGSAAINMVGRTSLRETAALLARCMLYVGNDTGPMHLAAAVGVPVVEVSCHPVGGAAWHHNSPTRWRPWGVEQIVVQPQNTSNECAAHCTSDRPHCILDISVEQVQRAIGEVLERTRTPQMARK